MRSPTTITPPIIPPISPQLVVGSSSGAGVVGAGVVGAGVVGAGVVGAGVVGAGVVGAGVVGAGVVGIGVVGAGVVGGGAGTFRTANGVKWLIWSLLTQQLTGSVVQPKHLTHSPESASQ